MIIVSPAAGAISWPLLLLLSALHHIPTNLFAILTICPTTVQAGVQAGVQARSRLTVSPFQLLSNATGLIPSSAGAPGLLVPSPGDPDWGTEIIFTSIAHHHTPTPASSQQAAAWSGSQINDSNLLDLDYSLYTRAANEISRVESVYLRFCTWFEVLRIFSNKSAHQYFADNFRWTHHV